jgi:hypothetical protein
MLNVNNTVVEALNVDLANVFMDLNKQESSAKERSKAQKKLAARRGIEQHYEQKQLHAAIKDFWEDF